MEIHIFLICLPLFSLDSDSLSNIWLIMMVGNKNTIIGGYKTEDINPEITANIYSLIFIKIKETRSKERDKEKGITYQSPGKFAPFTMNGIIKTTNKEDVILTFLERKNRYEKRQMRIDEIIDKLTIESIGLTFNSKNNSDIKEK